MEPHENTGCRLHVKLDGLGWKMVLDKKNCTNNETQKFAKSIMNR